MSSQRGFAFDPDWDSPPVDQPCPFDDGYSIAPVDYEHRPAVVGMDDVGTLLAQVSVDQEGFFRPRPYQIEAVRGVFAKLVEQLTTLVVMATGLGKTIAFSHVALCWPARLGRVLVIAHRQELIDQNREKIAAHIDEIPGIEMGDQRESREGHGILDKSKVLVSSVQSMVRRLKYFDPMDFGLVVCDEAHHAVSDSWLKVINHFQQNPRLRLLGVTATPKRADESALGQVFKSLAFQLDIQEAIQEGWLVDIKQKYVVVQGLDFSLMKTTAGDLNEKDLQAGLLPGAEIDSQRTDLTDEERVIIEQQEKMLHAIVDPTVKEADGRSTLVFGVTVAHAKKLAEVFNRHPGVKAECVFGDTPKEIRREIIGRFRDGHLQVLVGCAVFVEGFDAPETMVVAIARPTKSLTFYTQAIGRGTRPLPQTIEHCATADERRAAIKASRKTCCTVLDFCGNSGRHKLVSSFDVLGGNSDVLDSAKEWMRDHDETKSVDEAIADEEARREKKKREQEAARVKRYRDQQERQKIADERRRSVIGSTTYDAREVSPFGDAVVPGREIGTVKGGASDAQIKLLVASGIPIATAMGYTKSQAGAVIQQKKTAIQKQNIGKSGGEMLMDFGKHFGKQLNRLPSGYCDWVLESGAGGYEVSRNIKLMRCEK